MKKTEITALIASRPRVFGWIKFQKFLLWLFFVLGVVMFVNTCFIFVDGINGIVDIEDLSRNIAGYFNLKEESIKNFLIEYYMVRKIKFVMYSFFLCFMFFVASRYCSKIIKRNMYILELEEYIESETV